MDYPLTLELYFQRLGRETQVSPLRYRDASSYERLKATWQDERPLPTDEQLRAYWQITGESAYEAWRDAQKPLVPITQEAFEALITRIERLEAQLAIRD